MILQAVIFGAGHANYPAQPAYARLVELIIPALGFGGLYLLFGLVPAIVFHFAFDVVWFAMPLFAADTPGIWISRGLVIILTLIPLWVVLRARLRAGAWGAVPADTYNAAWVPPPAPERAAPAAETAVERLVTAAADRLTVARHRRSGGVWALTTNFHPDAPVPGKHRWRSQSGRPRTTDRDRESTSAMSGASWRMPRRRSGSKIASSGPRAGAEAYDQLLGRYLPVPRRVVRYAKFEGNVAERAEEFLVFVGPDGKVQRMTHRLPEGRAGAQLEEDEARAIAVAALRTDLGLDSRHARGDLRRSVAAPGPPRLGLCLQGPGRVPARQRGGEDHRSDCGRRGGGDRTLRPHPRGLGARAPQTAGRHPDHPDRLRRADGAVVSRRCGAGGGAVEPWTFRPGHVRHLLRRHGGARRYRSGQRFPCRNGPVHDRATVENAGCHRPHRRAHRHHRDRGGDQPVDRSCSPVAAAADELEQRAGHRRRLRPRRVGVGSRCS